MSPTRWLLGYASRYWPRMVAALVSLVFVTGLQMVQPLIIEHTVDDVFVGGRWGILPWLALTVVLAAIMRGVLLYTQRINMELVCQKTVYDIRNDIYRHLEELSFSFYDQARTGELMSRATADVEMLRRFLSIGMLRLASATLTLVYVLVLMFNMSPSLTWAVLGSMPLLVVAVYLFGKNVRPRYRKMQQWLADLTNVLQENITGVRVVRAFAQEDVEITKFYAENNHYLDEQVKTARLWAFYFPLMGLTAGLGSAGILYYGGLLTIRQVLTIGELMAFLDLIARLVQPIRMLGWVVNIISQSQAAGQRVMELLNAPVDVQDREGARDIDEVLAGRGVGSGLKGEIDFRDVIFSYDRKHPVLKKISLHANPGEKVALLGATGSGKTTIINLVPRFYDIDSGTITLDGMDIRDMTVESLRRHIGIVLQETFLFNAPLKDNIAYGRPNATMAEIEEAAKAANVHEFIASLPDGYNTIVGERGVGLSGGQKQRVAIARAILMDPAILILDDSTSSVDTETEHLIQEALDRLMANRTTFIIAQRLSTVKNADQIIVLEDGEIRERGTHATLKGAGGIYEDIYNLQFRGQETRGTPQVQRQTAVGGEAL
jgi:ATP-binding cassette subfamily B protein